MAAVLDDGGELFEGEATVKRELDPAGGRGDEVVGILPVAGIDGGGYGGGAADVDVGGKAGVSERTDHLATF